MEKKQKVRAVFQIGAWLAFIMLGYLGIRSYKLSIEKLKTNACIEEIGTLARTIQMYFQNQRNYGEFNYKQAVDFKLIPENMFREGFKEATNAYVEQVKELTEVLRKVAEQSQRLTRDSEEMENMNRTLTGINSLYEIQLRSVSSQVGTIDDINAQTKRLAEQIEELNTVYARMLEALKMNMKA